MRTRPDAGEPAPTDEIDLGRWDDEGGYIPTDPCGPSAAGGDESLTEGA